MIKHVNSTFEETYYEGKCDNGLKVVIWHKPTYHTTSCLFGVPYGSLDLKQCDENGNIIEMPSGIAHFLEHKLFESDHSDVMEEFSKLGCNVNAFTSYNETCYYFDTASQEDIAKPLNLLLDFVQSLNISEESVTKEKGIIDQELQMYLQMPDSRIVFETFKALYHHHPLSNDIGGNHDSVYATSKALLEECYGLNYHPNKMYLIIATPLDPAYLFKLICDNQNQKVFVKDKKLTRYIPQEPQEVYKENVHIKMDVEMPRVSLGIKLTREGHDPKQKLKEEWILRMILEAHFSSLNADYQTWLDEKKISPLFYCENDNTVDHDLIVFVDESSDAQAFKEFINEQLVMIKNKPIDETCLKQMKNRHFGSVMRIFNRIENITIQHFRNMMNGLDIFSLLSLIDSITVQDCIELYSSLDLSNQSLIVIDNND
ncbi:MAG: insulinase family protein [Erysipelotrichaceae bacterium]|nr:insulinase family protein [Erysipelotrichaceae bacterium]MDY5252685.1 pitrilysin family protein [Erysipelotrichaceae bacterium]